MSVEIQDVPVAPSEHTEAHTTAPAADVRRFAVYAVAVAASLLILWSLIEGGDRDLWTQPAALLHAPSAMLLS